MRNQAANRFFTVALHTIDQVYGGPEEGGWYYNAGYPAAAFTDLTRSFKSRAAAYRYAEKLDVIADEVNEGQREVSSVLYNGERVKAIVDRGMVAKAWPETRPYYD